MKKITGWALLAALMAALAGNSIDAQEKKEPYRPKIALVNIAKVLKEYDKANAQGKQIADQRQGYLNQVNNYRTQLNEMNKKLAIATDAAMKDKITKDMTLITRQIEDVDAQAQKNLGEQSNATVVSVYKEIRETITAIAESNGLELVIAYPDASDAKDLDSPVVAQLKLQTPAMMPFYHKNIDITAYVVDTLNKRYPVSKAATGAVTPDSNVKPVSGTSK
jgi:Skp family chaperone for outer membrane proteins